MKHFNVAFLTTSFPEQGALHVSPFLKYLFDAIQENGDHPVLVMPSGYRSLKEAGGILPSLQSSFFSKIMFLVFTLHFLFLILVKARTCDVIHANWEHPAFLAIMTRWIHRKKIILTSRSTALIYTKNPLLKSVINFVYNHVDYLVFLSKPVMEEVKQMYVLRHDYVTYIHNGIQLAPIKENKQALRKKLGIPQNAFVFLYVGRLIHGKGVDSAVEAYCDLFSKQNNKPLFYLVGDGGLREGLLALVRKHGLEQSVFFCREPITCESSRIYEIC